jgi:hypothetical protein
MPKKTLYIRDADLGIWEAIERVYGEKSMSELVTEALREKLGKGRDGFLHVLCSNPRTGLETLPRVEQFAVMFGPTDQDGPMQPRYCYSTESLRTLLGQLGLTDKAISNLIKELSEHNSSSVRVTLTESEIALITQELLVLRLKRPSGKFIIIAPDSTSTTGLSPHSGHFDEGQARAFLADKHKKTQPEIELLMKQAKSAPEV